VQYVKIKQAIVEQIDSGLLSPRQKLPAERKLAEMFDTTRVTLREALSILEAEGKIYREDRRGWFISPEPLKYDPNSAIGFKELAENQQRKPSVQVISAKSVMASKTATKLLELLPFTDVYQIERVRFLEQRPICYTIHLSKQDCFANILNHDLEHSLTEIYREEYNTQYGKSRYRINSTSLIGDVALALRATVGTPALLFERVNFDQNGLLINGDIEYWRNDAVCIESLTEFHI